MAQEMMKEVEQDMDRFKFLFTNSRPKIPAGFSAPLVIVTTRELIAERKAKLANDGKAA